MTEPPPPRYRVIERGRRLEVIDTRTGAPITKHTPGSATPPGIAPRKRSVHRVLALMLCRGATDEKGRPMFTSASVIDSKAPRDIALGPVGVRRLALTVLGIIGAVIAALGIMLWFWAGGVGALVVALAFGASRMQSIATRWIDRLEALDGR